MPRQIIQDPRDPTGAWAPEKVERVAAWWKKTDEEQEKIGKPYPNPSPNERWCRCRGRDYPPCMGHCAPYGRQWSGFCQKCRNLRCDEETGFLDKLAKRFAGHFDAKGRPKGFPVWPVGTRWKFKQTKTDEQAGLASTTTTTAAATTTAEYSDYIPQGSNPYFPQTDAAGSATGYYQSPSTFLPEPTGTTPGYYQSPSALLPEPTGTTPGYTTQELPAKKKSPRGTKRDYHSSPSSQGSVSSSQGQYVASFQAAPTYNSPGATHLAPPPPAQSSSRRSSGKSSSKSSGKSSGKNSRSKSSTASPLGGQPWEASYPYDASAGGATGSHSNPGPTGAEHRQQAYDNPAEAYYPYDASAGGATGSHSNPGPTGAELWQQAYNNPAEYDLQALAAGDPNLARQWYKTPSPLNPSSPTGQ